MNKLKIARQKISNLTQKAVATKCNITARQYQYYENEGVKPNVCLAIKIAKALNSTCEELWSEEKYNN